MRFPFLLSLAFFSLLVKMGCVGATNVTVHFINNMPKCISEAVYIRCNPYGSLSYVEHSLQVGEDYQWTPPKPDETYYCVSFWQSSFGDWHGYDPKRDSGHPLVYFNINKNGFYLGYDEAHLKPIAAWQTE